MEDDSGGEEEEEEEEDGGDSSASYHESEGDDEARAIIAYSRSLATDLNLKVLNRINRYLLDREQLPLLSASYVRPRRN